MFMLSPEHISSLEAATSGIVFSCICTSSVLTHIPLVIVHRRTYVVLVVPENALTGSVGDSIKPPVPSTIDHSPVPIVGVLASSTVDPPQICWSSPASATVGDSRLVNTTSSKFEHDPFVIVQR